MLCIVKTYSRSASCALILFAMFFSFDFAVKY